MRILSLIVSGMLFVIPVISEATDAEMADTKRYAIVVANNVSLDEGISPLRYADDDGARYVEMFRSMGAETSFLSVLDGDAQRRYPVPAKIAVPPRKDALLNTLQTVFARIKSDMKEGKTVHFYFIYAGHGNVGPNQEGYLNLLDYRFGRSDLYREIIARSPASFNHIILDACHSWYVVNKRGDKSDKAGNYRNLVQNFLNTETLQYYPNTGVLLAASSESETHEWQRFEAGIFSHELRSAFLGAGDVNSDGIVTYEEAAAFVEAANAAVEIPSARLKVFHHAPAQNMNLPLINLSSFKNAVAVAMPKSLSGRYHVEDSRGVRFIDLNYSEEQSITINLIGKAPFYLKRFDDEAVIVPESGRFDLSQLSFSPSLHSTRGSIESTFQNSLFKIPFGLGFYRGMVAGYHERNTLPVETTNIGPVLDDTIQPTANGVMHTDISQRQSTRSVQLVIGWSSLISGMTAAATGAVLYGIARAQYKDYRSTKDYEEAKELKESSGTMLLTSRIFGSAGIGLALAGSAFLLRYSATRKKNRKQQKMSNANLGIVGSFSYIGFQTEF